MKADFGIAVHALIYIDHAGGVQSSEQLAENICINPARVRKIMAKLKKAGLVETREGVGGGYSFPGTLEDTSLLTLAEAVEARFVSPGKPSGNMDMDCRIASGIGTVMEDLCDRLDEECRERLSTVTLANVATKLNLEPKS